MANVRRRNVKSKPQGLAQADDKLKSLMDQLERVQAQIAETKEQRLDIIGEAARKGFPEIDALEYGDDLVEFFRNIREDALAWRDYQENASRDYQENEDKSDDMDDDEVLFDDVQISSKSLSDD